MRTQSNWKGPSLQNYKEMHKAKAEAEGKLDKLMACRTLTQARKLLFGEKKSQHGSANDPHQKR